jgi:hypothetical protein
MPVTPIQSTTQENLDIEDITNNIVILRDGSACMALKVSAINFNLLSEEEQDSLIYIYAGLLNSLSFPIQILIRSQRKDITNYLKLLKAQEVRQLSPILKTRIEKYRLFIETIVKERNVLDKKFFIVIPFSVIELGLSPKAALPLPGGSQKPKKLPYDKAYIIQKALSSLEPKRDHLLRQLAHLNLSARQLTTQELIQLFYVAYNPDSGESTTLSTSSDYASPITQAAHSPISPPKRPTPPPSGTKPLGDAPSHPPTPPPAI